MYSQAIVNHLSLRKWTTSKASISLIEPRPIRKLGNIPNPLKMHRRPSNWTPPMPEDIYLPVSVWHKLGKKMITSRNWRMLSLGWPRPWRWVEEGRGWIWRRKLQGTYTWQKKWYSTSNSIRSEMQGWRLCSSTKNTSEKMILWTTTQNRKKCNNSFTQAMRR